MAKQRSNAKQDAFHRFLIQMERSGASFTMEDIATNTGYPLKGTVKAKISRNEWKNVLVKLGPNLFKAQEVSGLNTIQFAQRLSVKDMHEAEATTLSGKLMEKSIHAALSAIEIYNKPDFKYREETFAILMVNAWEVLLKAKIATDNGERIESLYQMQKDSTGKLVPKPARSGNISTISIGEALGKVTMDPVLKDHLLAIVELRDNAIHLMNDSPMVKVKVQEVGTATLRNYLTLAKEWFSTDLSRYNFYLMPMSFFHPHELQSYSINSEPEQHQNLLRYIGSMEERHVSEEEPRFSISLELRTEFVKSKLRFAPDDPNALSVRIDAEEAFRTKYTLNYRDQLLPALRKRYTDFKEDKKFNALRRQLESDDNLSRERPLDFSKPKPVKRFYSPNIFKEFDKHYTKRP